MTGARFSNVEKIEVHELIYALSVDLLAKRTTNLGTTGLECADEAALNESLDICVHRGPVRFLLDNVGGTRESSMTSKTTMSCDTNAKLQLIVLHRNVDLSVLRHPDIGAQVRYE